MILKDRDRSHLLRILEYCERMKKPGYDSVRALNILLTIQTTGM